MNWKKLKEPAHIAYLRKMIFKYWNKLMPEQAQSVRWISEPPEFLGKEVWNKLKILRKPTNDEAYLLGMIEGWNACLDKIKKNMIPN